MFLGSKFQEAPRFESPLLKREGGGQLGKHKKKLVTKHIIKKSNK
jgi:hypothetical protein